MLKKLLFISVFLTHFSVLFSQYLSQYFDGADTTANAAVFIDIDTTSNNVWQVGSPQKALFHSPFTSPNVLITDTINSYPVNNHSSFQFKFVPQWGWGIMALRWMQKLDMDDEKDGGIVEFSVDNGTSWENAFNNPHVYNFYGYNDANKDTLVTGEYAFSGRDTMWRDVWLCYDMSWFSTTGQDSMLIRFTLKSDSIDNQNEGWMIDNIMVHLTTFHTAIAPISTDYLHVYPNPAEHRIFIEIQKINGFHIIEKMELKDVEGHIIEVWENIPTHYFLDIQKYSSGLYYLTVKTNLKTETVPIAITR